MVSEYGFRDYSSGNGRWLNKDPINEKGGLNLYNFLGNDGVDKLDKRGLAGWVWGPANTMDYSIAYDSAMTSHNYPAPSRYRRGTFLAELEARRRGGLNNTLFQHYLHGAGRSFDLTADATIKGEVVGALTPKMDTAIADIRRNVESATCPGTYPGVPFPLSFSVYGDSGFTSIDRTGFTSSVWVIGRASAGLSKTCSAVVFCLCNRPVVAVTACAFNMYFYDQFADAADLHHTEVGAQEWQGGTQFDEIGAWGRAFGQAATYF
jgi:hypothetical protein